MVQDTREGEASPSTKELNLHDYEAKGVGSSGCSRPEAKSVLRESKLDRKAVYPQQPHQSTELKKTYRYTTCYTDASSASRMIAINKNLVSKMRQIGCAQNLDCEGDFYSSIGRATLTDHISAREMQGYLLLG
ncbi:hypothetical protein MMC18_009343 [Xylographa bjoerkii]|nr:hypothetical protein [Xylographa bjoerkii]